MTDLPFFNWVIYYLLDCLSEFFSLLLYNLLYEYTEHFGVEWDV